MFHGFSYFTYPTALSARDSRKVCAAAGTEMNLSVIAESCCGTRETQKHWSGRVPIRWVLTRFDTSTWVRRPKLPRTYIRSLEPAASSFPPPPCSPRLSSAPCPMKLGHCCAAFTLLLKPIHSHLPHPDYSRPHACTPPDCLSPSGGGLV